MAEVRELQMAQAWLLTVVAAAGDQAVSARVEALIWDVSGDPNGQGAPYRAMIQELRQTLSTSRPARK